MSDDEQPAADATVQQQLVEAREQLRDAIDNLARLEAAHPAEAEVELADVVEPLRPDELLVDFVVVYAYRGWNDEGQAVTSTGTLVPDPTPATYVTMGLLDDALTTQRAHSVAHIIRGD